jgi:predicted nuclease with TOPRIM domain
MNFDIFSWFIAGGTSFLLAISSYRNGIFRRLDKNLELLTGEKEIYREKSERLEEENKTLRERLSSLEGKIEILQQILENKDPDSRKMTDNFNAISEQLLEFFKNYKLEKEKQNAILEAFNKAPCLKTRKPKG